MNLIEIAAAFGAVTAIAGFMWDRAEYKRHLENQFQEAIKQLDIGDRNRSIQFGAMELRVEQVVSELGSQVDKNTGAIEMMKALRSNNLALKTHDSLPKK